MSRIKRWTMSTGIAVVSVVVATVAVAPVTAERGRGGERVGNYNFRVEIEGVDAGQFAAVDGLSVEQEIVEFRDGSDPSIVHKVPGQVKYGNLTLKRGYVHGDFMWDWIQASFDPNGDVTMMDGALILLDPRGREVVRYRFYNAWPAKWKGPTFSAEGNEVAIEEIVLAVESFEEEPPDE